MEKHKEGNMICDTAGLGVVLHWEVLSEVEVDGKVSPSMGRIITNFSFFYVHRSNGRRSVSWRR